MEERNETKSCEPLELGQPDFSEPWTLSDVVLAVENEKFHVHRSTLAMWSPVFENMFTLDFKEKQLDEVPLPEKKASEIREMLLVMYVKAKPVTENNVFFLLDLAQEYQMDQLRRLCEECLIGKTSKSKAIVFLVLAQKYGLDRLAAECITHGANLSLREIRGHEQYNLLDPTYGQRLAERRVEVMESQVSQARNHLNEAATNISVFVMPVSSSFSVVKSVCDWFKKNNAKNKPNYSTDAYREASVAFGKLCKNFGLY